MNFEEFKEMARAVVDKQDNSGKEDVAKLNAMIGIADLTDYEMAFLATVRHYIEKKYQLSEKQKITLGKILLKCSK